MKTENLYTPNCIRTFTGLYMNVFEPTPEMICIEDIAHALSHQCRFGGHLPEFYSVAQHCVMVSKRVPEERRRQGLLHDASEAYLLDMPSPIKKKMLDYRSYEGYLSMMIAQVFDINSTLHDTVKEADQYMLNWEWSRLMLKRDDYPIIDCWEPARAKFEFLEVYRELYDSNNKRRI